MRKILLTSAAVALAAAPAFAATNTPAGPDMNQSGTQPNGQMSSQNGMSAHNGMLRQQITQQLSQAGFTDVHVMPESFLVRAKDPHGNPVMMVINPDSITAVTDVGGKAGQMAQAGGQGKQGASGGAMGTSTMTNSGQSGNAINTPNGNGTTTR